ncbi:MAG: hypothetical protein IPJ48_16010 [Propionivibrio sp.]|uniref:SGNH hydrolase-type esterase domain-containing protein n=1 Tax=Candidatus Propionivibrio dominans TaxID=2954373 RepID=A0A9D7I8L9_9RHOO|nr:hypothetical protein [Candidatus Propionivibrio dominans]MBL0167310.1 hypothetical protein [Propionivibrio sp.]
MSARVKRFLANAGLAVIALAISFAFAEITVRFLYKEDTVLFPRNNTDYQYGRYTIRGVRANAEYWHTSADGSWKFVTNSKGLRNTRDFTYAKPAGTIRVLSLGDSQTQGLEVRQEFTYSAVMERMLIRQTKGAEVINAGVSGFSNAEELVFLENEGIRYDPDVVVLGFFANDFEDNFIAGLFGLDAQNKLVEEKYEHLPGVRIQKVIYRIPGVEWLGENSYFYSLLFNKVWNYFKEKFGTAAVQQAAKGAPAASVEGAFEYAVPTSETLSPRQIALAWALIDRMHRFCAERGIRFIVVDIPVFIERYRYRSSLPPALIEKFAAAHIEFVPSDTLLQNYDGVAEIHVAHGTHHISEFTHTLIGAEIGRRILARR